MYALLKFSCSQNPLCGESDGLGKFCVEILPQYALRLLMDCLQPSLLGTSDVFIVYQIWLHDSTWFIKTVCMQPTFFLPNVFTMQLSEAACKSSDCIGMCYMKNTTMRSEQQLQTRWIRKPSITFRSVINFYKQLCFTSWVANWCKTVKGPSDHFDASVISTRTATQCLNCSNYWQPNLSNVGRHTVTCTPEDRKVVTHNNYHKRA
jgi:hypothetical protein